MLGSIVRVEVPCLSWDSRNLSYGSIARDGFPEVYLTVPLLGLGFPGVYLMVLLLGMEFQDYI